jgi:hypothetical protein
MAAQEATAETTISEVITQDPQQVCVHGASLDVVSGGNGFIVFFLLQQSPMVLRLHKPKTDKKVQWREGTVDNEFMGKKSSKCTNLSKYNYSVCVCVCMWNITMGTWMSVPW